MKGETCVPLIVNGTRHQLEVTKKTTCSDVIKIATNDRKNYEICEIHGDVEKILPRNTKLLKQVRIWGINRLEYSLKLKKIGDKRTSKIMKLGRAKEALIRLKSMLKSSDTKTNEKNYEDILNNLDKEMNISKQYKKCVTVIQELNVNNENIIKPMYLGKLELMNRYLHDISVNDGLNLNVPTENEIDAADYTTDDNISDDLDDAFITPFSHDADSSDVNNELNQCLLYDTVNALIVDHLDDDENDSKSDENDDDGDYDSAIESAFEDISDCSSVCELDRNITGEESNNTFIKMNELKAAFSDGDLNKRIIDDKLLNSFMNTVVHDNDSDEGLSSLDSDSES